MTGHLLIFPLALKPFHSNGYVIQNEILIMYLKNTKDKLNYPMHEKELLTIKEALVKWKHYIENNYVTTILMDHQSLRYMNSVTKPSKRLARWIDEFQGFDLDICYRRGREAIVPDALSREPDYL